MRRTASMVLACVVTAALGAWTAGRAQQAPPARAEGVAKERIEAAKAIYDGLFDGAVESLLAPPAPDVVNASSPPREVLNEALAESLYRWSRRRMEAEREGLAGREGAVAAAGAHLDRMKGLESGAIVNEVVKRFKPDAPAAGPDVARDQREGFPAFARPLRYFRLEAEAWLEAAEAAPR